MMAVFLVGNVPVFRRDAVLCEQLSPSGDYVNTLSSITRHREVVAGAFIHGHHNSARVLQIHFVDVHTTVVLQKQTKTEYRNTW